MAGSLLGNGNLTGYNVGDELSLQDAEYVIGPLIGDSPYGPNRGGDRGAQADYFVHQGIISGLNPDGSGTGNILPTDADLSTVFPSLVTGTRKPLNIVRAGQSDRVVEHINGDSVLFVIIADSSGTLTARFVT
jgi:hypothetical protein